MREKTTKIEEICFSITPKTDNPYTPMSRLYCYFSLENGIIMRERGKVFLTNPNRILLSNPPPSKSTQLLIDPQGRVFVVKTSYGPHSMRLSRKFHFGIKFLKKINIFGFWCIVQNLV